MEVYQLTRWLPEAVDEDVSPGRIVVQRAFAGFTLLNPEPLLQDNYTVRGAFNWGIQEDRTRWLYSSFPVEPDFPVDKVRKQTLVCLAVVAKEAARCIAAWSTDQRRRWSRGCGSARGRPACTLGAPPPRSADGRGPAAPGRSGSLPPPNGSQSPHAPRSGRRCAAQGRDRTTAPQDSPRPPWRRAPSSRRDVG
jgi:hypothetical protein